MNAYEKLVKLTADNDQDAEHARQFFRDTSPVVLMGLFCAIRVMCESENAVRRAVGRLAQLKFCELLAEIGPTWPDMDPQTEVKDDGRNDGGESRGDGGGTRGA